MTFTLSILINLCLIFAVWRVAKRKPIAVTRYAKPIIKTTLIAEDLQKYYIVAKMAEKTADRAFNLASSANLGVIALQKSLAVPRIMTKTQATQNRLAKQTVDELFTTGDKFDFLRPILSDEELNVLDALEADETKNESQ